MQTLPLNMFKTGTGAGGKAAGTVVWVVPAVPRATVHSALNAAVLSQLFQRGLHTFFLRQNYQNYSLSEIYIIRAKEKKSQKFQVLNLHKSI